MLSILELCANTVEFCEDDILSCVLIARVGSIENRSNGNIASISLTRNMVWRPTPKEEAKTEKRKFKNTNRAIKDWTENTACQKIF